MTDERTPLYKKDAKIICPSCGDHVATLACDVFFGDLISESQFTPDGGQGPWKLLDALTCRKCSNDILRNGLFTISGE